MARGRGREGTDKGVLTLHTGDTGSTGAG